jgi:hypothetical protein
MAQCHRAKVACISAALCRCAGGRLAQPCHGRGCSSDCTQRRAKCVVMRGRRVLRGSSERSDAARRSSAALALRHWRPYPYRMARRAAVAASVLLCSALSACGANHFVQRGADLYGEGRYVEADEVFERSEPRLARAPLEDRAAYAAYRGATFVALGDLRHARHWLTVASELERSHPGALRTEERQFLDGAWRALTNRLPKTSPAPAGTAIASSSQAPSPNVELTPPPTRERVSVPQ